MSILNIGVLAHVDAGKTSLTERILYETGVIAAVGSVDKGTTQTDTMELERARGITIRSAVVSFQLGDLKVNLIDTPGHSDFVAEVERSLRVLDAVILVISAVEGVQSQTRRLARAIRAAGLPMLIYVNKIDRIGARGDALLDEINETLGIPAIAMNSPAGLGSREARTALLNRNDATWKDAAAEVLAETSERVIAEFDRTDGDLSPAFLSEEIHAQVAQCLVAPAYFGSAMTGVGITDVLCGIVEWLPPAVPPQDDTTTALVFKIARQPSGEKIVYARLFSGSLEVRQQVQIQRRSGRARSFDDPEIIEERITGVDGFADGAVTSVDVVRAGDIAALHGLRSARIGDIIGNTALEFRENETAFPAPALQSVIRAADAGQVMQLRTALEEMAEQDPFISLRQRNEEGEISVRLFGEVQKEVMQDSLLAEYGIAVTFGPSQTIYIERPTGVGEHLELMGENGNPIMATVGVRVEPGEPGSGIAYQVREMGSMPPAHYRAVEESVFDTLSQGLSGWEVTDCRVTLTEARTVQYSSPTSTAGDFRKLTPFVVMQALRAAGTEVCEPLDLLVVDVPEDTVGAVCGALIKARGTIQDTIADGAYHRIFCEIPTAELRSVEQQLPRLTRGEGGWESSFLRYVPVAGDAPARPRIGPNPLDRARYFLTVAQG